MTQGKLPTVLMIMICLDCGLGGAEKRYARVFKMLVARSGNHHKLLINRSMLDLLQTAGILTEEDEPSLIVLTPPFSGCLKKKQDKLRSKICSVLRPILKLFTTFWYMWQCWWAIHHFKPKIVQPLLTGMYLSLPALMLHPKVGHIMPAYATQFKPHNYSHTNFSVSIAYAIKRYAMRRCHAVDALKTSIRDDLVAYGFDSDKIYTAPCSFTDISLCQPASERQRWIVYLGRFIDHKNPLLLARAIPAIVTQVPDVHFYFLGKGHLQLQLEALVTALNIEEYVTIKFEINPLRILNQSSLFASMQTRDNYPSQSLLEAMACGNAIVATDVGETWRLVDETNGIRIPANPDALAQAVVKLMHSPKLAEMGLASRQRVLMDYSPERYFDYIYKLYQTEASK